MNDRIQEGAVCSLDGCSTNPTTAALQKHVRVEPRRIHDLTIVSDVICPWCYVAKKHFEAALKLMGAGSQFQVTWRPYELNPDMPKGGMDRRAYRSQKFGSWEHSQSLDAQVATVGTLAGLVFRHDLIARTPNTFQAHRLIWFAGEEGVQDAVVEALFRVYFTEGRDVGDTSVLIEIATQAGIDKDRASAFLHGSAGVDEVRLEEHTARANGISGVPSFILDGESIFSGALKPNVMAAYLREAVITDDKQ